MFDCKKIVSNRIEQEIPEWLQNMLWYMIETMEVTQKDRFQVFEASGIVQDGVWKQRIVHTQQHPIYQKEHIVTVLRTVSGRLLVVMDGAYCVMHFG